MTTHNPAFLHYIVGQHGNRFIAHCLDYDLVASADDQQEAIERLNFIVRSHVETAKRYENQVPLAHRAPDAYWETFEKSNTNEILSLDLKGSAVEARFELGLSTAQVVRAEPVNAIQ